MYILEENKIIRNRNCNFVNTQNNTIRKQYGHDQF